MALVKLIVLLGITALLAVCLLPIAFPFFILSLFGLKYSMGYIIHKLAQGWALFVIAISGCSMTVTGRENIPKRGGVCFVSNHVGIFDIVLALAYTGRPFGFIAKKELILLPGINIWIYLLGGLFIDRKKPRKALKTINRGIKRLKAGGAMLIFPEGTRSRGRETGPFLPGSLKLATQSEAFIVPVAISGSYDVVEKEWRVNAGPVSIHYLPVVNPKELPPEDRKILLAEKIHDIIVNVLERQKTG